jgi:hypothetical protein
MSSKNQRQFWDLAEKDDWRTPPKLVNDLDNAVGGIDTDPCAHKETSIGDTHNYRLEDGQNGLELPWKGVVFVNPPFSHKKKWLKRAVNAVQDGDAETVIVLTPDSTDTRSWWHKYIAPHAKYICFKGPEIDGTRLDYIGDDGTKTKGATFNTAISVFGKCPPALVSTLQKWGHVVKTVRE